MIFNHWCGWCRCRSLKVQFIGRYVRWGEGLSVLCSLLSVGLACRPATVTMRTLTFRLIKDLERHGVKLSTVDMRRYISTHQLLIYRVPYLIVNDTEPRLSCCSGYDARLFNIETFYYHLLQLGYHAFTSILFETWWQINRILDIFSVSENYFTALQQRCNSH